MRQHLAWPHLHPPGGHLAAGTAAPRTPDRDSPPPSGDDRWQVVKDKLAVAAVLLLVAATATVFVLYLVQQGPHFAAGELTAFVTPMPAAAQQAVDPKEAASVAGSGLGRIPLILISTVVEMGIFVALGLYLRHDMQRKP